MVVAFYEIFRVLFFFICLEDELQWLGRAFDPGFVMSEEELLLGHVSSTAIGPKYCLGHDFFLDRILLGQARSSTSLLFWAGPHIHIFLKIYTHTHKIASEHTCKRVLRGTSIFFFNKKLIIYIYYNLRLLHFPIAKYLEV